MTNREIGLSIGPLCEELIFDDISANLISQLSVIVMVNVHARTPGCDSYIVDSQSRRLPVSLTRGVADSLY
jgi:hypothetical protein